MHSTLGSLSTKVRGPGYNDYVTGWMIWGLSAAGEIFHFFKLSRSTVGPNQVPTHVGNKTQFAQRVFKNAASIPLA